MQVLRSEETQQAFKNALFVSEQLRGCVTVPKRQATPDVIVVLHSDIQPLGPDISYNLTDEGDLYIHLPKGSVVLQGVEDSSNIALLMRAH